MRRVSDVLIRVVEKGEQKDLALAIWIARVGEIGAVHGVTLPQVAKVGTLETTVGLGTLLGQELGGGSATAGELAAQGTGSEAGFGDGVGSVEGKDADDGAGGAEGLLAFEGLGPIEGLWRDSATRAPVGAGLGLEAVEASFLVDAFPAG